MQISLTAVLLHNNFLGHVMNYQLSLRLASYLRSGDQIRWVVRKTTCEYKVIVSVMKSDFFPNLIAVGNAM